MNKCQEVSELYQENKMKQNKKKQQKLMLILASQVANSHNQIAKANGSFSYIISSSGCYFPYLKNEGIGMR